MRIRKCRICGQEIDMSACGQTLAHIHIERDNGQVTKNQHLDLCEDCTTSLDLWIATKSMEKLSLTN